MHITRIGILLCATLAVAACGGGAGPGAAAPGGGDGVSDAMLTKAQAHDSSATKDTIAQGKAILEGEKCSSCHPTPAVTATPSAKWPEVAKAMAAQAKLSDPETSALIHYVMAASN